MRRLQIALLSRQLVRQRPAQQAHGRLPLLDRALPGVSLVRHGKHCLKLGERRWREDQIHDLAAGHLKADHRFALRGGRYRDRLDIDDIKVDLRHQDLLRPHQSPTVVGAPLRQRCAFRLVLISDAVGFELGFPTSGHYGQNLSAN